jgi:hypothetical protein
MAPAPARLLRLVLAAFSLMACTISGPVEAAQLRSRRLAQSSARSSGGNATGATASAPRAAPARGAQTIVTGDSAAATTAGNRLVVSSRATHMIGSLKHWNLLLCTLCLKVICQGISSAHVGLLLLSAPCSELAQRRMCPTISSICPCERRCPLLAAT